MYCTFCMHLNSSEIGCSTKNSVNGSIVKQAYCKACKFSNSMKIPIMQRYVLLQGAGQLSQWSR